MRYLGVDMLCLLLQGGNLTLGLHALLLHQLHLLTQGGRLLFTVPVWSGLLRRKNRLFLADPQLRLPRREQFIRRVQFGFNGSDALFRLLELLTHGQNPLLLLFQLLHKLRSLTLRQPRFLL